MDFEKYVIQLLDDSFLGVTVIFGHELKIFDHLDVGPRSSQYVASEARYKQCYVDAWLKIMAEAGFVESDGRFWLTADQRGAISKSAPIMLLSGLLNMVMGMGSKVKECFKADGPCGTKYSDYEKFRSSTAISESSSKQNVIKILHSIPKSVKFTLASPKATYLDIGCGVGIQTGVVSAVFPQCTCIGVDIEESAIQKARDKFPVENHPNLHFLAMDATKLPAEWTSKFDYVTTFDAIHDLAKPDEALREIYRVLKPGGIYSMVDVDACSNVSANKSSKDRWRHQILYTISLYHCMPISLGCQDGGAGLGAMWGREKASAALKSAGFVKLKFRPLNDVFGNYHCLCRKQYLLV